MISARALVAGFVLAAVVAAQTTRPAPGAEKRKVDALAEPEALALWILPGGEHVAAVTSCGAVSVFGLGNGALKKTILTGASGWIREVRERREGKSVVKATLRGIPVAAHPSGPDALAAVTPEGAVLSFDFTGRSRLVCQDERLAGATIVRSFASGGPILVGTADGTVHAVSDDRITGSADSLHEAVLALAVDPKRRWFFSAGEGPYWDVRTLPALQLTAHAGNHIGQELIHALDISPDARLVGVSHGYTGSRIKTFGLKDDGLVDPDGGGGGWKGNGGQSAAAGGEETLAFDSTSRMIVTGDVTGAVRVFSSDAGDATALPRSTRLPEEVIGSGRILTELGSWRVDPIPIRGVRFASKDSLVVSLSRSGAIVARSWPAGEIKWTAQIPDLCPAGGAVRIRPRTFNFGKVQRGSTEVRTVEIAKTGSPDLKILGVEMKPPGAFSSKVEEVSPGALYKLTIWLAPDIQDGYTRGTATIKTNLTGDDELRVYFYVHVEK